jgi:hypothetical protein
VVIGVVAFHAVSVGKVRAATAQVVVCIIGIAFVIENDGTLKTKTTSTMELSARCGRSGKHHDADCTMEGLVTALARHCENREENEEGSLSAELEDVDVTASIISASTYCCLKRGGRREKKRVAIRIAIAICDRKVRPFDGQSNGRSTGRCRYSRRPQRKAKNAAAQ